MISIDADGTGTKYTATALHADVASKKSHEQTGFLDGWGMALDQLVEVAKTL